MDLSLVLTGAYVNGVLGVSPSCHFVFHKYFDFWISMGISLVWLVLCPSGKFDCFFSYQLSLKGLIFFKC